MCMKQKKNVVWMSYMCCLSHMYVNIFLSCGHMKQLARHFHYARDPGFYLGYLNHLYDLHRSHILCHVTVCRISDTSLQNSDILPL